MVSTLYRHNDVGSDQIIFNTLFSPSKNRYLAQQLHPPIARMCEPIEGIDPMMLGECLGMDTANLQSLHTYFAPEGQADDSAFVVDVLAQV